MGITGLKENAELLAEIKKELEIDKFDSVELEELIDNLRSDDFDVRLDGREYRFIAEGAIDNIFADSIREMVEDCYGIDKLPTLIACHIDWDGIVRDCRVDGYGHHFSSYDGSEAEVKGYYIFRNS